MLHGAGSAESDRLVPAGAALELNLFIQRVNQANWLLSDLIGAQSVRFISGRLLVLTRRLTVS